MSWKQLTVAFMLTLGSVRAESFFPFCIDTHDAKHRTFEQQATMLKELGYDGVGHLWLDKVDERIKTLDAVGLKLYQIVMPVDLTPGKPPYDARKFKDVLALVTGRQIQFCLLVSGGKPSDPAMDAHAVEILHEMSDSARESGAQLVLYPHADMWLERIEDAMRVAGKVERPNVGVMFNLCHWLRVSNDRNYKPLLQQAMPRLRAVSINGADDHDDKPGFSHYIQPLDEGTFDIATFLKTLRELGYQGPIGLQCYGIGGDVREHLTRSLTAWRKLSAASAKPIFTQTGKQYQFDTGALRGTLHTDGKSLALTDLTDVVSGAAISRFMGLFSHYRMLDADTRYGDAAWDWPSTARLLPDGAVEVTWAADATHPFDMTATYRWASPNALDLATTVTAHKNLRRFEVFLASYFEGFPQVFGYGKSGWVEASKDMGDWLAFPRDEAATAMIADGRWQRPPNPVTFKPVTTYTGALGMRRDAKSGLTTLVMAPPADCFAVMMPYGEEAHRSLYLSLFGRDFKDGESATAHARLVIGHHITDPQAIELYNAYLKEIQPSTQHPKP